MTQENKSINEVQWVEDETERRSKEAWVAWLLWLFTSGFGGHRFYFGKTGSAVGMIALQALGFLTIWIMGLGTLFYLALGIWVIVDAFLISGWLKEDKEKTRVEVERDLAVRKGLHG